VTNSTSLKLC